MKHIFYYFILCIATTCCGQGKDKGLSRIERINNLPYRTINLKGDVVDEMLHLAEKVWMKFDIDTTKHYLFIYGQDSSILVKDSIESDVEFLRKKSYNTWRSNMIMGTLLLYPSSSYDLSTGLSEKFYVMEIEHKKFTGTFRVFIDNNRFNKRTITYSYVDRN